MGYHFLINNNEVFRFTVDFFDMYIIFFDLAAAISKDER